MAEATSPGESGSTTAHNLSTNLLIMNPSNQINTIKLTDDNFLLWQLQVLAGIRGLGLDLYIDPQSPIPPSFLPGENGTDIPNPLHTAWSRQDQLLFSFLLASMTEGIQSQMIGCSSSAQIWIRVSTLFANRSKARMMQYKLQLQTLKKGSLSMKYYLSKMKSYVDSLAACGHSVSDDDQILYILGVLVWSTTRLLFM